MSTILYTDDNHQCIKFDGQTIGGEVQANQFLIKHDRRGMLIGCGGQRIYKSVLAELSSHLPAGALDYIFCLIRIRISVPDLINDYRSVRRRS